MSDDEDDDSRELDAQIGLIARQVTERLGIQGQIGRVEELASKIIKSMPKWHVTAACETCKITEECVEQNTDDEAFIKKAFTDHYSTHQHPVVVSIEKVSQRTHQYTMRCIKCRRQHTQIDGPCDDVRATTGLE